MFETLFKYPGVVARHRGGPFTDLRERFLIHCVDQGLAHATLLHVANELLVVAGRIDLTAERQISIAEIEAAADAWSRYQQRRQRARCPKWSRERFIQTAVPWLHFLGRFQEKEHQQRPDEHIVQDFASFMRHERGLSEVTVRGRCWQVNKFLDWLNSQDRSFGEVALQDVDAFLAGQGKTGCSRVSVATSANALRSFFRHAEVRGWCTPGMAAGIEGSRIFQQEALPAGPAWGDVQRLIASVDSDKPRDIRDRPILMLFAIYAFRSGEVALKQIGDHLGHRSAYATRVYAKVDLAGLRQVADFDLGDLV